MKLNLETIRSLLLYLESNLTVSEDEGFESIDYRQISSDTGISAPEVINTLFVLDEAHFITISADSGDDSFNELLVNRITYDGYQFLETIRPEPVFKKIQRASSVVGSASIPALIETSVKIISSLLFQNVP
ncbi:DUF2513 domain-containing protein [Porcincola intestinalis]|uniref:DUF2513 domain-containing protein n=1 Tax=Porcincola intestinalis TaxID=2606632 RepID=A0A6L5X854_9FIRM|nr:DUF2513 domain-containing protein [Porcincola intestinalis]MSS15568.1 DUF2513 domain-containing protein [Porcincola intestinalis]